MVSLLGYMTNFIYPSHAYMTTTKITTEVTNENK